MASMVVGRVQDFVEQETVCERLQVALSVYPTATHAHAVKISLQWQHIVSVKWLHDATSAVSSANMMRLLSEVPFVPYACCFSSQTIGHLRAVVTWSVWQG